MEILFNYGIIKSDNNNTFIGAGHPLNGSFIIVVLSYGKGKDSDLEHKKIEKQLDLSFTHTDTFY